jgi:hypothetical protein
MQEKNLGSFIVRPKPERLSPHQEGASSDEESSSESSVASSVGARGAAISLGDLNVDDLSSGEDERIDVNENNMSEDDESSSGDDSDNEPQNLTEEPPILPQQSILQEIQLAKSKFGANGSQTILNKAEPKAKRVLSSNTLSALNAEAGRNVDSPKRMRTAPESFLKSIDSLPELSLGLSAMGAIRPLSKRYSMLDGSQAISSDDDEELDNALSDELRRPSNAGGDNSPVPLLTPPQSPLTIPTGNSDLVEWPSNMVVDSAMMSAMSIVRPLSAQSLQKLEEEEEARLKDIYSHPEPSSLTPLLRSIYVGIE